MIVVRRVYEEKGPDESYRVFVDRLWPRGLSRRDASWDEWMKEISPTPELRKWFNHDVNRWDEFRLQYSRELQLKTNELKRLKTLETQFKKLTLVYAAKDREHNHALVIKEMLENS